MVTPVNAQGTVVKVMDNEATPALQVIGGIQSIGGGTASSTRSERDRTTLASTEAEFGFGLKKPKTFTLNCLYDKDDVGQAELLEMDRAAAAVARQFEVTLSNNEVRTFDGYVVDVEEDTSGDSDVTVVYTIQRTGAVTIS